MGADDFYVVIHTGQRADEPDNLAHARIAGFQIANADVTFQMRRIAGRGDITLIMSCIRGRAFGHQMRASGHGVLRVHRFKANQFQRIFAVHPFAFRERRADAVFLFRHHPPHTKVEGRGRAVQLIARGMPLFDPHNAKRFGAINYGVKFFAGLDQFADHRIAIAGRDGNFIGEFA